MNLETELVLASASPRRLELLTAAGWRVRTAPAEVDETARAGEGARDYVLRLAREKAVCAAAQLPPACVVLGADTVVVFDGEILGKPRDAGDAARMLRQLSGQRHEVLTGVCLLARGRGFEEADVVSTAVWFNALTAAEIEAYTRGGEPMDKAGAYAIQGEAARFIPRIEGSYSNVVGLPLALVWELWRRLPESPLAE